jgi:hypothetical protein
MLRFMDGWILSWQVIPTAEGSVFVNTAAAAAFDRARNPSTVSSTLEFVFDTTSPTVNVNTTSGTSGTGYLSSCDPTTPTCAIAFSHSTIQLAVSVTQTATGGKLGSPAVLYVKCP